MGEPCILVPEWCSLLEVWGQRSHSEERRASPGVETAMETAQGEVRKVLTDGFLPGPGKAHYQCLLLDQQPL